MNADRTSRRVRRARRRAVNATLLAVQHAREHGDTATEWAAVGLLLRASRSDGVGELTDVESAARELDARHTGGRPEDEPGEAPG